MVDIRREPPISNASARAALVIEGEFTDRSEWRSYQFQWCPEPLLKVSGIRKDSRACGTRSNPRKRLFILCRDPVYREALYNFEVSQLSAQAFQILVALADRDQHGYGIMLDIAQRTGGKLRLSAGTLYGSIKRLLEQGFIVELRPSQRPGKDLDDERRRYYRLTPLGRKAAKLEVRRMSELVEQARAHGLAEESN